MVNTADGRSKAHPLLYVDTQLRYHLGVNPDELTDKEWAISFAQLAAIRKRESHG